MKETLEIASNNFKIYGKHYAKVVNNEDPKKRGRLQVDIIGMTDESIEYPWAETEGLLFGSSATSGLSSAVKIGSLVYVEFVSHDPSSPLVTGYVRGNGDSSKLHKKEDLGESIYNTRLTRSLGPEQPPLNDKTNYPDNFVIETAIGLIELDDTKGNERISIEHKNGAHFELRPDGSVQIKSLGHEYNIISGSLIEHIEKCVQQYVGGDFNNTTGGLFKVTANGGVQLDADVHITKTLKVDDNVTGKNVTAEVAVSDGISSLSDIRSHTDSHTHSQNDGNDLGGGVSTQSPDTQSNQTRAEDVIFTPVPRGCSGNPDVIDIPGYDNDTSESYYTANIQPSLGASEVPEGYPTNSEQVEQAEALQVEVLTCDPNSHENPFEHAEELMNYGYTAWKETGSNPNITALWDTIGYNGANFADETAWCAVFVSAVLKRTHNKYLKTASSQAYRKYGIEVDINDIKIGDIVVFYRKGKNSGYGHVGFYAGGINKTHIAVLGGNQGNNLNVRYFRRENSSKGWGIRTIRRAVRCDDGTTEPEEYSYTIPSNIYNGGSVT